MTRLAILLSYLQGITSVFTYQVPTTLNSFHNLFLMLLCHRSLQYIIAVVLGRVAL